MRRLRARCCASRTSIAFAPTLDSSRPIAPSSISRNRDVMRRPLLRISRLPPVATQSCRLIGSQRTAARIRSILPSSPQQLKQERGYHGMAKRYRTRRVRKPAASANGPEPVPTRRGHLQPNLPALPKLRRRPSMPRHQLRRHPRQTRYRAAGSNRPAPPNLPSAMPNLRMFHYL